MGNAEIGQQLNGVSDGVSQIQQAAKSRVALVLLNTLYFPFTAARDDFRNIHIAARDCFQICKQFAVKGKGVLDDLCHTAGKFLLRQTAEKISVAKDKARLPETARHIFAAMKVNTGLSADSGIHAGKQRRRNIDRVHAAGIYASGKACQIAGHAAAEGDHHVAPGKARLAHLLQKRQNRRHGLGAFPGRKKVAADLISSGANNVLRLTGIQFRHLVVADEHDFSARLDRCKAFSQLGKQVIANQHIRTSVQRDMQFFHWPHPSPKIQIQ